MLTLPRALTRSMRACSMQVKVIHLQVGAAPGSACYCHSDNQALSAQKMICSHSLKACSLSTTFPLTGRVAQQVSTHVFGSRLRTRSTAGLQCSTHSASALTKLGSLQSGKTPGNFTFWYPTRRIICKVHEQRGAELKLKQQELRETQLQLTKRLNEGGRDE